MEFKIDVTEMVRALKRMPNELDDATKAALTDIKNDWVAESVDIAPIYKKENYPEHKRSQGGGTLRQSIHGDILGGGVERYIEVSDNATRNGFNYAYYIHEMNAGGKQLREPGTEKKFLDKPLDDNKSKYERWLREEYEKAIRRSGWR